MKKGFTLVEIMAVILILGVILVIAIPTFNKVVEESKNKLYKNLNETVVKTTKTYATENAFLMPTEEGESVEVTVNELISTGYLKELKNPGDKEDTCNGYVIITRLADEQYAYNPHINCSTDIASSTEDGLVLHYTFDDFQEPTTNLIPNGEINSYPTIGNSHSTYNVNQYNSNTYFSIGTIGSVTNNIITLSTINHPIYTYDVLRPQTSGGGVTAGVNYFVKKISENSFSLHAYNAVQDGSLGFSVHDSIINDIRININATNFPTVWWGAPHLANSSLVKEIIPSCFSSSGSIHECIRLHTDHKLNGAIDGMAYGVYPVVEKDKQYTFSFYYRAVDDSSVGTTIRFEAWTSGTWLNKHSEPATKDWKRFAFTSTASNTGNTNLYFFPSKRGKIDISEIQVEQKAYATPFVVGSRTGIIKDYSSNDNSSSLTVATTPRWTENGYEFDGINDTIIIPNLGFTQNVFTVSMWIKPSQSLSTRSFFLTPQSAGIDHYLEYDSVNQKVNLVITELADVNARAISLPNNSVPKDKWTHIAFSINNQNIKMYVNGEKTVDNIQIDPIALWSSVWYLGQRGNNTYYYKGLFDDIRIYNRSLSENEIAQIYNLTKY